MPRWVRQADARQSPGPAPERAHLGRPGVAEEAQLQQMPDVAAGRSFGEQAVRHQQAKHGSPDPRQEPALREQPAASAPQRRREAQRRERRQWVRAPGHRRQVLRQPWRQPRDAAARQQPEAAAPAAVRHAERPADWAAVVPHAERAAALTAGRVVARHAAAQPAPAKRDRPRRPEVQDGQKWPALQAGARSAAQIPAGGAQGSSWRHRRLCAPGTSQSWVSSRIHDAQRKCRDRGEYTRAHARLRPLRANWNGSSSRSRRLRSEPRGFPCS